MAAQRALIIGENPRERMAFATNLEDLGFEITVAPDGAEAAFYTARDDFDMIVADFSTPHFSPIDFLEKIKLKAPDTELLFVSDTARVADAVDAMKQGAMDFLIKPVDPELIALCARRALSRKKESDPMGKGPERGGEPVAIVTQDPSMERLLNLAARVADSTASVLIQGESGTGKELFARFIHEQSNRRKMPFVAVNCAALPETLLESELFGHEKGAFTGALSKKPGKFELANRGTLLLDEITEMPFHLQAKLLRVLQEKVVDRVGGTEPVSVDVRVVSTTNRDIREAIADKAFREDLYYRLNTIPLVIPPLRDRLGDLALLCDCFILKYSILDARGVKSMTKTAVEMLRQQPFVGNVRELENIIHRAVLLCDTDRIDVSDLLMDGVPQPADSAEKDSGFPHDMALSPLREMEEKMIFHTLDKTEGNRTHAAKILGISVRTLRNKLNEYKKNTAS
ncbi:putative nitrogen assimilation regulatory protein NtrC [Desulforapulum autotrophicum HRM2]|uniref:Nitrogen assimilation regulatory protein NtrC n=1 Tax=Desulforapulum autotrophicum (strain ATCC 43914 / DSM 3382 / VKM B-1955 / HRM2) TaxID=177437 RepID=C0QAK8_DESAH|nr:sigma-54 dependent transcriptional regulator [Desulforapulum autotrophicum]ACN16791.1 putative nitrogen assimilation regulatory protein NtrC [Desulforapulum autotrophicum HRM2]